MRRDAVRERDFMKINGFFPRLALQGSSMGSGFFDIGNFESKGPRGGDLK